MFKISKKYSFLVLLLLSLCQSSCSSRCREWQLDEMLGSEDCYNSSRLYLLSDDAKSNLELVLIRSNTGIRMYFNTFSLPFPFERDDACKTVIKLSINGNQMSFIADRLQGGQRLLLPQEAAELIISSLMNADQLSISVGRYQMEVISLNFSELFLAK